jgi:hypothetical protein
MRRDIRSLRGTWLAFVLALVLPAGHAHAQQPDQPNPPPPGVVKVSGSIPLGAVFPVSNPDGTTGYSVVTGATDPEGNYLDPEAVDDNGDSLYAAGFPAGSIYQFSSLGTTTETSSTTATVETAPGSTPDAMGISTTISGTGSKWGSIFMGSGPNPNGTGWMTVSLDWNSGYFIYTWTYMSAPPNGWTSITTAVNNMGAVMWTTTSSYFMNVAPSSLNALQPTK